MDKILAKYSKYSILAVLIGAMIAVPFYEGYAFQLTTVAKVLVGLCIYISLGYAILTQTREKWVQLTITSQIIILILIVMGLVSIFRGVFYPQARLIGDLYLTLFFNPVFAPMFFFPVYLILTEVTTLKLIRGGIIWLSLIIVFFYFGGIYSDLRVILPLCLFFPIMSNSQRVMFWIITLFCIYCNFIAPDLYLGATRRYLFVLGFFCLAYFLVYILQKRRLTIFVSVIIIVSPIVMSLSMSNTTQSVFEKIQEYWPFSEKEDVTLRSTDTRTFLYEEMALDLTNHDAWTWGKGAYSSYYSYFFSRSSADSQNRAASEVTFLHYTLRAGLTFSLLLALFLIYAGLNAVIRSRNLWIRFLGLNILGFYLSYFVSDFNFFDFVIVCFWICVGLCINKEWLDKTDEEIRDIFKQRHLAETYEQFLRRNERKREGNKLI